LARRTVSNSNAVAAGVSRSSSIARRNRVITSSSATCVATDDERAANASRPCRADTAASMLS
jgi:hypothetical protein